MLREGGKRNRIRFTNREGAYASNVAFRIRGTNLLYKESGFGTLKFFARIPPDIEETDLREVQIGIRVVDAMMTHWMYALQDGYKPLYVKYGEVEEWVPHTIDLSDHPARWKVFQADGNHLYHDRRPDFSMILAVVVEIGSKNAQRPGSGNGVLELMDFAVE